MNNKPRFVSLFKFRSVLITSYMTSAMFCAPVFAIDLLQTYQDALQNDSKYASAKAEFTAGQEKLAQGRAFLLPTLTISGTNTLANTDYDSDVRTLEGIKTTSNKYTLQLTQPLFRWENWQRYEQGKLQVLASEAKFRQAQLDLMVRVAQAYFDVLFARDVLESAHANAAIVTEQFQFAISNFEVGINTVTDKDEAQARYELAVANELAAESDLEVKRAALEQIIGYTSPELAHLNKEMRLPTPEPHDIKEWISAAEQNNYSVVAAQVEQEIAKRAISLNRAGHFPTLDLVASLDRSKSSGVPVQNLPGYRESSRNIGIQLNVPLFAGFSITSKVREAIALEDKAGNDVITAKRNAALAARQAFLGAKSGLAQITKYAAAEVASQSAVEATMLGYQVGVRILTDLLNAQEQLYTIQRNLAKARYETILNGLRLKFASGSLKEEDLALVNGLLY